MNRNRFLIVTLSLGGLLGAAGASSNAALQQKRLEEFSAKARAARRAQKLEGNRKALYAKYPTPEIEFTREQPVRAGAEATVGLSGSFQPGSLVLLPCEGVEVLSTQVTAQRAEARVRVSPYALPQLCELQVISPVSLASNGAPVLRVASSQQWELKLANGMTARFKLESRPDGTLRGDSEWFHQGKAMGTRPVTLEAALEGVRATVERTEEENNAAWSAQNENPAQEAAAAEFNALLDRLDEECSSQPDEKRSACERKYAERVAAASAKLSAIQEEGERRAKTVSAVCDELKLRVQEGQVSGQAFNCGGSEAPVTVTGSYKPLAAR